MLPDDISANSLVLSTELARFLGVTEPPKTVAFQTLSAVVHDTYDELRIEYTDDDGEQISAFLLLPHGNSRVPAVLAPHQHASEWHLVKSEGRRPCG